MKPLIARNIMFDHTAKGCNPYSAVNPKGVKVSYPCTCEERMRIANADQFLWAIYAVNNLEWWDSLSPKEKTTSSLTDKGMDMMRNEVSRVFEEVDFVE